MIDHSRLETKVIREELPSGSSRLSVHVTIDGVDCGRLCFMSNDSRIVNEFIEGRSLQEIQEEMSPPKTLVDALFHYNVVPSKSVARRMIEQGAVSVAGEKITDVTHPAPRDKTPVKVGHKVLFYRSVR